MASVDGPSSVTGRGRRLAVRRRQGIATRLTHAAEREARAMGFDRIQLRVSEGEQAAQALYAKCGYRDAGLRPERVQGVIEIRTGPIYVDDTLLVWEKRLLP